MMQTWLKNGYIPVPLAYHYVKRCRQSTVYKLHLAEHKIALPIVHWQPMHQYVNKPTHYRYGTGIA